MEELQLKKEFMSLATRIGIKNNLNLNIKVQFFRYKNIYSPSIRK